MAPPTSVHQATRPPAFSSASLIPAAGSGAAEREAWLRAGGRLGGARAAVVWLRWRCRAGCRIPGRARRGSARSWTASGASAITSPTTGAGASWSSVWPHPGHAGSLQLQEHLPGLVAMPFCQLGMVRTGSDPAGVVDPGPAHKNGAEDWQCPLLCHCDIPRVTLSRTQTLTSARWDYSSLSFCSRHPPPASMTSPSPPAWSKTVVTEKWAQGTFRLNPNEEDIHIASEHCLKRFALVTQAEVQYHSAQCNLCLLDSSSSPASASTVAGTRGNMTSSSQGTPTCRGPSPFTGATGF
ncbi:uncharacterized protein LOC104650374 isoform X2 [Saimiri boliviensis]|uniref:uncharacterized protein LOC104650374 isoform X2 n=1 Tax=Saimiri boliviensis TaxID=27679 RepID=UPI003D77937F